MVAGKLSLFFALCCHASLAKTTLCDGIVASPRGQERSTSFLSTARTLSFSTVHEAFASIGSIRSASGVSPFTLCLESGHHELPYTLNLHPVLHSNMFVVGPTSDVNPIDQNRASLVGGSALPPPTACASPFGSWWCFAPPADAQSRQFYVNNQRAQRTFVTPEVISAFRQPVSQDDDGYTIKAMPAVQTWVKTHPDNVGTIELVFRASTVAPWTESRCTVANVSSLPTGDVRVHVKQPCFNVLHNKPCGQGTWQPTSIENVPPMADAGATTPTPGTWYLDLENKRLMYYPRAGEQPSTSSAVMPVLELLVASTWGEEVEDDSETQHTTSSEPTLLHQLRRMPVLELLVASTWAEDGSKLTNFTFEQVSFEYATWRRPSGPLGYVEQQSGALLDTIDRSCNDTAWHAMPGNLQFNGSLGMRFTDCVFQHLGAGAIQFRGGAHDNLVSGCQFTDVSAFGVQIGDYDTEKLTDPAQQELRNTVFNSLIDGVACEFHGNCGIQVGYASHTNVTHNELANLPYGGISVGWGWAREPISYSSFNNVDYNKISNFKYWLGDGGGIYALGPQPNSTMYYNWVDSMRAGRGGGGYYPDEGSAYWDIGYNVFSNSSACSDNCEWLHIWTSSIHDISVHDCFTDTATQRNQGTRCPEARNTVVPRGGPWPAMAQQIMQNAGRLRG